jgi:hypothetical protein
MFAKLCEHFPVTLTPDFSRVQNTAWIKKPFQRLASGDETVKTVLDHARPAPG